MSSMVERVKDIFDGSGFQLQSSGRIQVTKEVDALLRELHTFLDGFDMARFDVRAIRSQEMEELRALYSDILKKWPTLERT